MVTFSRGKQLYPGDPRFDTWLKKCSQIVLNSLPQKVFRFKGALPSQTSTYCTLHYIHLEATTPACQLSCTFNFWSKRRACVQIIRYLTNDLSMPGSAQASGQLICTFNFWFKQSVCANNKMSYKGFIIA